MKARAMFIVGAVAFMLFFVGGIRLVQPGTVGVVVNLFGDHKGVEAKELPVGAHLIAPWKRLYVFPVFEQNHTWEGSEGFSFQTADGMAVHADIGITFSLDPSKVPMFFQKYRRGMEEITHLFVRNHIRDAVNKTACKMHIDDLYGFRKEEFFATVEGIVKEGLSPIGMNVSAIYLIGGFAFPANVIEAMNNKMVACQRAEQRQNELKETEAQARKTIAEAEGYCYCEKLKAETQAIANKLLSESLTRELLAWQAIQKWDGQAPKVLGSDPQLLLGDIQ